LLAVAGYVTFLIVDVALRQPYNLVSFGGMITFMLLMFFLSIDRWHVSATLYSVYSFTDVCNANYDTKYTGLLCL